MFTVKFTLYYHKLHTKATTKPWSQDSWMHEELTTFTSFRIFNIILTSNSMGSLFSYLISNKINFWMSGYCWLVGSFHCGDLV